MATWICKGARIKSMYDGKVIVTRMRTRVDVIEDTGEGTYICRDHATGEDWLVACDDVDADADC